jgi:hypothetical protein
MGRSIVRGSGNSGRDSRVLLAGVLGLRTDTEKPFLAAASSVAAIQATSSESRAFHRVVYAIVAAPPVEPAGLHVTRKPSVSD